MKLYGIFGAGGFGREVMPLAAAQIAPQKNESSLVFVTSGVASPKSVNGFSVLDLQDFLAIGASERFFNVAIADWRLRKRFAETLTREGCRPFQILARSHERYHDVEVADGAIFCANSIATSNVRIGKYFHCNLHSYVAHDCIVGDYVTFAPSVHCNGRITVEDEVYIGTGAIIREGTDENRIIIGRGAVIGMGAVVTKSVPPGAVMIGNPARPLQKSN